MTLPGFSALELDALREVGSIGAGHAATALSQLVDRPVHLAAPEIEVVAQSEIASAFAGPQCVVCAVYASLLGDIGGGILFMASEETSLALLDLLGGVAMGTTRSIEAEDAELLGHAGSILISAYLSAIARTTGLDVLPSSPTMVFDMAGAILQAAALEVDIMAEQAVLVRNAFLGTDGSAEAALFFLPDPDSMAAILNRLGVV